LKGGSKLRVFAVEFKGKVVQRILAGESVSQLSREVKVKEEMVSGTISPQEQLGLKLVPARRPVEILVIDSVRGHRRIDGLRLGRRASKAHREVFMSFRSIAAKNVVVRIVGVMVVAGAAIFTVSVTNESFIRAQSPKPAAPPKVRLPDESAGIDGIARTLISVFDQADIVALGETHVRRMDTDLRIAVVRHPDFARKVRSVVVEFGSTTEQPTLDRYIRG
jgi:hypothetical protein